MISIRPLEERDIAAIQAIDLAAHGQAWSERAMRYQLSGEEFDHLVATEPPADPLGGVPCGLDSDKVVGHAAAWLQSTTLRITNVAVAASGRGVGTRLMLELLASSHDYSRIELETRPGNRTAQRFYLRFGFAPVGVVRRFYDRSDDRGSRDAIVMAVGDPNSAQWRAKIKALGAGFAPPASQPDSARRFVGQP